MDSKEKEDLEFLRKYAKLLDSQFKIPGTNITFGIDPIIGLIPGLGSFSGLITGSLLIFIAKSHGISQKTQFMMIRNLLLDFLFGLVPVVGNIKDVMFKANNMNIKLIEENLTQNKHNGHPKWVILNIIITILISLVVIFVAVFFIVKFLISFLSTL